MKEWKTMNNNYLVFYSEECSPKVKRCKSMSSARRFVTMFEGKHKDNTDDNWVDFIVKGEFVNVYPAGNWVHE